MSETPFHTPRIDENDVAKKPSRKNQVMNAP